MRAGTAPALPGRALTKRDLAWLEASWITREQAAEARLRRVDREDGCLMVGQKETVDCAGIAFPYAWPGNPDIREWRIRRDRPEKSQRADGSWKESRKYLSPPGRGSMLYFAPGVEPGQLEERTLPVVLVEGEKKTLALQRLAGEGRTGEVGPRFIAAGIAGVWNWRHTTQEDAAFGGRQARKEPIPDLDHLRWDGRTVYICFDADVATNKEVYRARWALAKELGRRKAQVLYLEIPLAFRQKGVDDLLAAQGPEPVLRLFETAVRADLLHDVKALIETAREEDDQAFLLQREHIALFAQLTELQRLDARAAMKAAFPDGFRPAEFDRAVKEERKRRDLERDAVKATPPEYMGREYVETEHGLWRFRRGEGGYTAQRLTNFQARIESSVVLDDGETRDPAVRVEANLGELATRFILSTSQFSLMQWPMSHIAHGAIVYPGQDLQVARTAIQELSQEAPVRIMRTHTGWGMQEGQHVFFHAGGAIGKHGLAGELGVDFPEKMKHFCLPDPNQNGAVKEAIQESLRLLSLAPVRITMPLYAAIWRVPMGPVNVSVFLSGQTQTGKTQLGVLAQQHFGRDLIEGHLPATWIDSAASLENKLFQLKDVLSLIDDFNPQGGEIGVQKYHALADRVIRSQGNRAGRGRMTSDLRERAPRWPRGMIVATGEDTPLGHSLRARMVILDVSPGDVRFGPVLTEAQLAARQGAYALAMASYVQWLAPRMDRMEGQIAETMAGFREAELREGESRRAPDNLAQLAIGMQSFLDFAVDRGAISETRRAALWEQWLAVQKEVLMDQESQQAVAEPCRMFVEMLRAAITSGKAHLADTEGLEPSQPKRWGWREEPASDRRLMRPMGDLIGWVDGTEVYLEPRASFAAAKKMARDMGENIPISPKTLAKRLKDRNMLSSWNQNWGENLARRVIQGDRKRVLALWSDLLSSSPTAGQSVHGGNHGEMRGTFLAGSGNPSTVPSTANRMESTTYSGMDGLYGKLEGESGRSMGATGVDGLSPSGHANPPTESVHQEEIEL